MNRTRLAQVPRNKNIKLTTAYCSEDERFAQDLIHGLSRKQKQVPSRYFYDAQGSALFEQITQLPEYYLTCAEIEILKRNARHIARYAGERAVLIEFGSGSSRKTEILLDAMPDLTAYVPIDVSTEALQDACTRLGAKFPAVCILPLQGDFTTLKNLPDLPRGNRRLGFFPGSTIGNFDWDEARSLLERFKNILGGGSQLITGVDLLKDPEIMRRAYEDSAGVTARFNLNLLAHANRCFGKIFDLNLFEHRATYNEYKSRIEMHLVSKRAQSVTVLGRTFHFAEGEMLRTELSHKYTLESFARLASAAGWRRDCAWLDQDHLFSVQQLTCDQR